MPASRRPHAALPEALPAQRRPLHQRGTQSPAPPAPSPWKVHVAAPSFPTSVWERTSAKLRFALRLSGEPIDRRLRLLRCLLFWTQEETKATKGWIAKIRRPTD